MTAGNEDERPWSKCASAQHASAPAVFRSSAGIAKLFAGSALVQPSRTDVSARRLSKGKHPIIRPRLRILGGVGSTT